jgi:predicted RNA-binding Zn-ribbon protein involved in translation (DUF1610 family)
MARTHTSAGVELGEHGAPLCDCGAEMEPFIAGTRRTGGLFSPRVDYRLFTCPQCGDGCRLERARDESEWHRLTR